jgi:P4 family phage/plasmid primase-like protien
MFDDDDEIRRDEIEAFKSFEGKPDNPWESEDADDEGLDEGTVVNNPEELVNVVNQFAQLIELDKELSNTPVVVDTQGEFSPSNEVVKSNEVSEIEAENSEEIENSIPRLTDVSLARYVKKTLVNELGYIPDKQMMMLYSTETNKWLRDGNLHYTKQKIRLLLDDIPNLTNDKNERDYIINKIERSGFPPSIAAELKLIANEIHENIFDANPLLMGVQNGVIDLSTGEFRPGKVEDYITRMVGVPYVSTATCPLFEQVAYEIMGENMELHDYLQMLMGYICLGHNPDQIFVIMQGRGDNGKSLLLNIIELMLGNYATSLPLATVVDTGRETVGDDLMSLVGYRTFIARELKKEQKLHAAKLKLITGNDTVSARRLYGHPETIRVRGVPIIGTNEIPQITDSSNGLWRRMRLMPFTYIAEDAKKDPDLIIKLMPELPGILNWSLKGFNKYQAGLFKEPKIMLDMKQNLRDDRSPLEMFIFSHYIKSSEVKVGSKELHDQYLEWINKTANAPYMSQIAFSKALVNLGIEKFRPKATMFGLKPKEVIGWNEDEIEN